MRPQLGSPPCSAHFTSGEFATARATGSTASTEPRTTRRATRSAPSPSATISSASWRSSASSAAPKAQLVLACRARPSRRPRRSRCRTPSRWWTAGRRPTMRSNERSTAARSSRSSVTASSAASVWTKQSMVAKEGEIIPAPFACAQRRTDPPDSGTSRRAVLGPAVGGHDRLGEDGAAVRRQLAGGALDARRRPARGRGRRRSRRWTRRPPAPAAGRARSAVAATIVARDREPALAVADVRDAAVDDHCPQPRELGAARDLDRRRDDRVAREQRRRRGVVARRTPARRGRAAPTASSRRRPRLPGSPGAAAAARPRATPGGRARTHRERKKARSAAHRRPSASSRPSITLRFCTACPAAPFHRLSIAANTSTRPSGAVVGVDAADVRVAHVAHARRHGGQLDEALVAVGVVEQLLDLAGSQLARRRHVAARQQALVERQQVRHERDAAARGRAPPAPGRSRARGGGRRPRTAFTFSSADTKCVRSFASRPAPDTPLFASTTASAIRPARASGASARIAAVE